MKIGDTVLVSATSDAGYDENGKRRIYRDECEPFFAVITGRTRKNLGEYQPARHYHDDGDDPPSLKVTGTKTLWLVRVGLENKEIAVDEADMEPQLVDMRLPNRGVKPRHKVLYDA